jgi:hypothetical protein
VASVAPESKIHWRINIAKVDLSSGVSLRPIRNHKKSCAKVEKQIARKPLADLGNSTCKLLFKNFAWLRLEKNYYFL